MRDLGRAIPRIGCALLAFACAIPSARAAIVDASGNPLSKDKVKLVLDRRTNEKQPVWLAYQGCRPTERPADSKAAGNRFSDYKRPIRFMEEFGYADRYEEKGVPYILLVRSNGDGTAVEDLVGWVDGRFLVESTAALKEPKTKIIRKGMIIYAPEAQGNGRAVEQGVRLRLAPIPNAGVATGEMKLFTLFFIFAETPDDLLLGLRPQFGLVDDAASIVLGWAPKKRVCEWTTREAFDWAPPNPRSVRKITGQIYRTPEGAHEALVNHNKTMPTWQGERPDRFGMLGAEWPPDKIRYPLMKYDAADRVSNKYRDTNEMFRVGVVGGFSDGAKLDPEALSRATETLSRDAQTVEILFVIDETQSMRRLMPIAAEMVRNIVDRGVKRAAGATKVRVAVSYYGDDYNGSPPATPAPLLDAGADETARLVEAVGAHAVSNGGDQPERVFYGIREAIRKANFSDFSRKMVIVIGDMGNKNVAGDPSEDEIAAMMVPATDGRFPIDFCALQVCDPENPANQPEAKNFQAEMNNIIAKIKLRVAEKYAGSKEGAVVVGSLSEYYCVPPADEDKARLLDVVDRQFEAIVRQSGKIAIDANKFATDFQTVIGPELEKALKEEYGYDVAELRKIGGFQLFTYGYVWAQNEEGQPQIRTRMLINEEEAREFLRIINALTSGLNTAGKKTPADVIREIVEQQAGQTNAEKLSLNEVVENATGLRVSSGLLHRKVEDLTRMGLNTPFRRQELRDIEKKKMKLEDMLNEVQYVYEDQPIDGGGQGGTRAVRKGGGRPMPRKFHLKGDLKMTWYWVDLAEEWP